MKHLSFVNACFSSINIKFNRLITVQIIYSISLLFDVKKFSVYSLFIKIYDIIILSKVFSTNFNSLDLFFSFMAL